MRYPIFFIISSLHYTMIYTLWLWFFIPFHLSSVLYTNPYSLQWFFCSSLAKCDQFCTETLIFMYIAVSDSLHRRDYHFNREAKFKEKKMLNAFFIFMDSIIKRIILNERKYISLFNHCHILLILTYNINVDKPDTNIVCATFCTRKHFFWIFLFVMYTQIYMYINPP